MGFSSSSTLSSINPPPSPFPLELRDDTVNSTVDETLLAAEATPLIQLPISETENFGIPQPLERLQENPIPPFLSKTFDLVDDPSLDPIITWASTGESFVVREPMEFARLVLPRNFKHSNFSSFVRQLNTYGFRKIEADKWEFANECFIRGKRHLLKSIQRRRSTTRSHPQLSSGGGGPTSDQSVKSSAVVEKLKEEKCVLMQEVEELQQQHRGTVNRVEAVKQRLQASEERHKEMISFFAKIFQDPVFVEHLRQMKAHRGLNLPRTKRKLVEQKQQGDGSCGSMKRGPDLSNCMASDIIPKPELSSPEYLLQEVAGTEMDLPLEELASVHELTNVPEQVMAGASILEPSQPLSKGSKISSPEMEVASPDYFMAFPEDLAVGKGFLECASSETENLVKQEEMSNMGFDVTAAMAASDTELWGNVTNYAFPEMGLSGSDGFSDIWGLGSFPAAGGLEAETWTGADR